MRKLIMLCFLISCQQSPSKLNNNIVGGVPVTGFDDPVMRSTALLTANGRAKCTGTLISEDVVVTAAHCLRSPMGYVGFGTKGKDYRYRVLEQRAHPGSDIGVIRFDGPVDSTLTPVPLGDAIVGETVTVAGYGQTGDFSHDVHLRKVRTPIDRMMSGGKEFNFVADGKGSCYGDSGGPVYRQEEGGGFSVIGAVSRSGPSGTCNAGDNVNVHVGSFKNWIREF